jgi:thymidylate synthase
VGSYNHISDSLHIYECDLEEVVSDHSLNLIENPDSLSLVKHDFDLVLSELEIHGNRITDDSVSAKTLLGVVRSSKLPIAYRNIFCVLSAEGARKRNCSDEVEDIMGFCTNPAYHQLWGRWLSRFAVDKQNYENQV